MANTGQLDEHDRERLIRLLGMTGSDHDGEAINAVRLAGRLLQSKGVRWRDVILPQPELPFRSRPHAPERRRDPWLDVLEDWPAHWTAAVRLCRSSSVALPGRSRDFLQQIGAYKHRPSEAQLAWLHELVERCRSGAG